MNHYDHDDNLKIFQMSDVLTLSAVNSQLSQLLSSKDYSNPKIKQLLKKGKITIYSNDNIQGQSQQFLSAAMHFSQLSLMYTLSSPACKESDIPIAIDNVKFFYENPLIKSRPANQSMIIAIHLLFLLSSNRNADFFVKLESLNHSDLADGYIQYVLKLNDAIEEGNYSKVFQLRKENTLNYFTPFLDRITETVRTQIAKSAERAYSHLNIKEALEIFQVSSVGELTKFIARYQQGLQEKHVNWKVTNELILFEKDTQNKIKFNSDDLIKTSLHYAVELEKIA